MVAVGVINVATRVLARSDNPSFSRSTSDLFLSVAQLDTQMMLVVTMCRMIHLIDWGTPETHSGVDSFRIDIFPASRARYWQKWGGKNFHGISIFSDGHISLNEMMGRWNEQLARRVDVCRCHLHSRHWWSLLLGGKPAVKKMKVFECLARSKISWSVFECRIPAAAPPEVIRL